MSPELARGETRLAGNERAVPACAGCSAFLADVADVGTDRGPLPLCWICRHAVKHHRVKLAVVWQVEAVSESGSVVWPCGTICMCGAIAIYPVAVLLERGSLRAEVARHEEPARDLVAAQVGQLLAVAG